MVAIEIMPPTLCRNLRPEPHSATNGILFQGFLIGSGKRKQAGGNRVWVEVRCRTATFRPATVSGKCDMIARSVVQKDLWNTCLSVSVPDKDTTWQENLISQALITTFEQRHSN